jgi:hypothetical protein
MSLIHQQGTKMALSAEIVGLAAYSLIGSILDELGAAPDSNDRIVSRARAAISMPNGPHAVATLKILNPL